MCGGGRVGESNCWVECVGMCYEFIEFGEAMGPYKKDVIDVPEPNAGLIRPGIE